MRNGEQFLGQAIEAALAQTRPADEILVVDDASSDGTKLIATDAKWAGRVRYVYNDNATGFADAFNRVAHLAMSDFVVFLSADDLLDARFLASVEGALERFPEARFCYVASQYVDAVGNSVSILDVPPSAPQLYDGKQYVRNYLTGCFDGNEIHRCVGVAVERSLMADGCGFRKDAGIMADNDFFIRLAAMTKVVGISEPLATVRIHAGAISSRLDSLNLRIAEDYLYQVRFLTSEPGYLADEDLLIVFALAYRSVNLLLLEAILRGRRDLGASGIRLYQEISLVADGKVDRRQVGRGGALLRFVSGGSPAVAIYRLAVFVAEKLRKTKKLVAGLGLHRYSARMSGY